ncbi:MAG: TIR domain-containing protein [Bryobacteraceae bacterium]|nr:TIR domain-containing protein [Bryobacteraceae bacterium]
MASSSAAAEKFDVFVSYARSDAEAVSGLVKRLEADGFRVWFDAKQMGRGHRTISQLADGIARSAHMIACLSDAYIDRDYTAFELETNQSFDPANKQNRTIPVVVRPLTKEIPTQIRAFTYGDLTSPEAYEAEYERISSMLKEPKGARADPLADKAALEEKCAAPLEHQASAPSLALMEVRVAAEALLRFVYRREIGPLSEGQTLDALRRALLTAHRLPPPVRIAVSTLEAYGNYVVEDVEESASVTADSIQPALSALRLFADWVLAHYFEPVQPADSRDALWRQLPAGGDASERRIPGTPYVACQPRLGDSEFCAVYSGRDTKWRQAVTVTLYPPDEENAERFFALASALIRGTDAGEVRPLDAGKVTVEGHSVCFYVVTEWLDAVPARDLAARFGALPLAPVLELGAGAAGAIERLHGLAPALVLGDLDEDTLLVDRQGKVKLCWTGSQGLVRHASAHEPRADVENLWATLERLLRGPQEQPEPVAAQLGPAPADGGAKQVRLLLEERLRARGNAGLRLIDLVESYHSGRELPASREEPLTVAPRIRAGCNLLRELRCECLGAWPSGTGRLLIRESDGHGLSLFEGDKRVWQTNPPVTVRTVVAGADGSLGCGGWNGELIVIRPDGSPLPFQMDGTVGDLIEARGNWIAGSWRHELVCVDGDGTVARMAPAPPDGVYRLVADGTGARVAVASLSGVISIYTRSGRVAEVESQGRMPMLAFCGRRLLVLAGNRLGTFELDGRRVVSEKPQGTGRRRLAAWPAENRCLLVDETGGSWLLEDSGAILPYVAFGSNQAVRTPPSAAGRVLIGREEGWTYWRDGFVRHEWPGALDAEFSGCGTAIAVRLPGRVEVWADPL